jgi:riboflavin synthase
VVSGDDRVHDATRAAAAVSRRRIATADPCQCHQHWLRIAAAPVIHDPATPRTRGRGLDHPMFTGLVADLGTVAEVHATSDGVRMAIESPLARELREGDSIAVNGVCLTAVGLCGDRFGADVMHETLRRSSLGEATVGTRVNLELPLRPSDRLGGHVVQGHVDGVGVVTEVREDGFARVLRVQAPPEVLRYVVEKGSIAVDGVSLTVAALDDSSFEVSLIPETLERTNLGSAGEGTPVNLETDVLAKYVERLVAR